MKRITFAKYDKPRIRHHSNPNVYLPLEQQKVELKGYPPVPTTLPDTVLAGKQPTCLDIGCGMGKFMLEYALNNPQEYVLGLEVREIAVRYIKDIRDGENLANADAMWYSVANGLPFIHDQSISKVFYFFADPWFKKRHVKRRAFSSELLNEIARVLCKDGVLYVMTDVPELDEYHREILTEHNWDMQEISTDEDWGLGITTNQEHFSKLKDIPYTRLKCTPTKD